MAGWLEDFSISDIIPVAGDFVTTGLQSILNKDAAREEFKHNLKLQQQAQNWQEEMSNTAYQRGMADMEKAGLNPNLAFASGGGSSASTPSGGGGSVSVEPARAPGTTALMMGKMLEKLNAEIENIESDTTEKTLTNKFIPEKTKAEIANTKANTALEKAQHREINQKREILQAEIDRLPQENKIRLAQLASEYEKAKSTAEKAKVERAFNESMVGWGINMLGLGISSVLPILKGWTKN